MKSLFRITLLAALTLLAASCARHTIIPDDELALIFHDAFLTNAYTTNRNMQRDSLNVYEPIFAAYGYTTADVQYTIGNFSKRKSARLGDVVEAAIALLEQEGKYYEREVAILDTIDNVARRTFTRRLRSDSLIRVRSLKDTALLRMTFDTRPGEFDIALKYLVDSLDRNERGGLKASVWLERRDGSRMPFTTFTMRRNREELFSRKISTDSSHVRLHLDIAAFEERPRTPSVTVTDLSVDFTPEVGAAVDSLYEQQLDIRIFADEFFHAAIEKDSL